MGSVLLIGLGVGACDQDEQGRVLNYKKGEYLGPTEQPLDEDTMRALRERARLQGGTIVSSTGGGGGRQPDVRPPASSSDNLDALRQRGGLQRSP